MILPRILAVSSSLAFTLAACGLAPPERVAAVPLPSAPWNPFTQAVESGDAQLEVQSGFEPVTGALREECTASRFPVQVLAEGLTKIVVSSTTTVTGELRFRRLLEPLLQAVTPTCDAEGVCRVLLIPASFTTVTWAMGTLTQERVTPGCFQVRGADGFLAACGPLYVTAQTLGGLSGAAIEIAGLDGPGRSAFEDLASGIVEGSLPITVVVDFLSEQPRAAVRTTLGAVGVAFPQGVVRTHRGLNIGLDLIRAIDGNARDERARGAVTSPSYGSLLERDLEPQRDCDGRALPLNESRFQGFAEQLHQLVNLRDGLGPYVASKRAATERYRECSQWAASQAPLCRAALDGGDPTAACSPLDRCSPSQTERF